MPLTSDGIIKLVRAGVTIESVSAVDRTSDVLIKIGQAIIAAGGSMRIVNCQAMTSDSLIKVHQALGGKVVLTGV